MSADYSLPPEHIDRIVEMAWEDRTPFEAIFAQFELRENDVRALMRAELKPSSFRMWRARVTGRITKHGRRRPTEVQRFKSAKQKP